MYMVTYCLRKHLRLSGSYVLPVVGDDVWDAVCKDFQMSKFFAKNSDKNDCIGVSVNS